MTSFALAAALAVAPALSLAAAPNSPGALWAGASAKRAALPSYHQEFEETSDRKTPEHDFSIKWQLQLDGSKNLWRLRSTSGSGTIIKVFDGQGLVSFEDGGDEYVPTKLDGKSGDPLPGPYDLKGADWDKASVMKQEECPLPNLKHTCVVMQIPLKHEMLTSESDSKTMRLKGAAGVVLDLDNGLILMLRKVETMLVRHGSTESSFVSDVTWSMTKMSYGAQPPPAAFTIPAGLKKVSEFKPWNGDRIRKELAGDAAPPLNVTDMNGKAVSLADYKGKTVLLDFFTTWCGPCREDMPSLEKLYAKYGHSNLIVISISVSENRPVVEAFLKQHPRPYPVVLSSENQMPRPYQVGEFPTYVVIDPNGTLTSAMSGTQGFGELKHVLKKAGMDTD